MKRSSLPLLIVAALWLASCEAPSDSSTSVMRPGPSSNGHGGGGGTTAAHPAIVYTSTVRSHGSAYYGIYVMDTDGTHQTEVLRAASSTIVFDGSPSWSPDGTSIAFTQLGNGSTTIDTMKAFDISVNSSGVPVASNLRVIYASPNATVRVNNPFWCSTSSTGKIAFTSYSGAITSLYTVSTSGGSPTLIFSADSAWNHALHSMGAPTWNADDSRLAVLRGDNAGSSSKIMIFDVATSAYTDSISVSGAIYGLEWSRSGINKIAFSSTASGTSQIYYVDPTNGATPSSTGVAGLYPSWSPDNSSIVFQRSATVYKSDAFSSTSSALAAVNNSNTAPKWRR